MKSNMATCAAAVVAVVAVNIAIAAEVSKDDASKAAAAFVSSDAVGSAVLSGRSVANVAQRGRLWIASLAPSGHIVMSGSDFADPIVGFSKNDFTEPDPESPAFAVLEGADASVASLEAKGGTRHERWTKLLGGGDRGFSIMADNPPSETIVVEPFLAEHYNQWQPYNDYAPVYEASTNNLDSYRGRCPCGCVATAAAQIFHHFKWPARIDGTISYDHVFKDDSGTSNSFPIRFDGHEPISWNAISNNYIARSYDLRGVMDEAVRYPIARLILWCDVMAHMYFKSGGSSANYETIAGNVTEWYTPGRWVQVGPAADYSQVITDLRAGIPLQVGLDGHEVVGHGWAQNGASKYIYLNYGWGGSNDGYYNLDNSTIENAIQEIYVEHYPRAKPQIDPLPAVSGTSLSLNWNFPELHASKLSGFTVSLQKTATETTTFSENFTNPSGVSSVDTVYVGANSTYGYDGNLLCFESPSAGMYTFSDIYTLTSASVLKFKLRSVYALGASLEVQARFNGGGWETIATPSLAAESTSGWSTERVYLGEHGGATCQLRVRNNRVDSWYYPDGVILVDDIELTDVLPQGSAVTRNVSASARSCAFTGLDAGSTCTFTVTPVVSGALAAAETSEPMTTSIAGERRTPIPGVQTYSSQNLVFSSTDTSGTWAYSGTATSSTAIEDFWDGSVSAKLQGALSAQSVLSFSWKANNNYTYVSGVFSAVFTDSDGVSTTLWTVNNNSSVTSLQNVSLPLGDYAGKTGVITVSFSFSTSNGYSYGEGVISGVGVTNVQVPSVPQVAWNTETLVALGTPEILSVSAVTEGFYGECGTNSSTFTVTCSSTVDSLEARPSHLSLVRDSDVTVTKTGSGTFSVSVTPSGINEANFRSRMLLTLVATDSNGTKSYKDLSLRFSPVEQTVSEVVVSASTSGGVPYSVTIPYSWIEDKGLVSPGSDAAAHEAAVGANADADSDGLPNWAEYVCGTSPTNSAEKVTVSIAMDNGEPVVTYTPADSQIAPGFKAVIKGAPDLSTAFSSWEVVTETRTSTCKFFRVEIVPESQP